jgi:hypothetical protein
MEAHHPTGNVLPAFRWGEYVLWALYPRFRVGMDARYEMVYPIDYCEDYFDFLNGREGWKDFLDAGPHEIILVEANTRIHELLRSEPDWEEDYSDATSAMFWRKTRSRVNSGGTH